MTTLLTLTPRSRFTLASIPGRDASHPQMRPTLKLSFHFCQGRREKPSQAHLSYAGATYAGAQRLGRITRIVACNSDDDFRSPSVR
jgi:hypothetical protein